MLERILKIKEIREAEAQRVVGRARVALFEASQARERAQGALEVHVEACRSRESELYAGMMNKCVSLREIDDVTLTVDGFKQSIHQHRETLSQAKNAEQASEQDLQASRGRHGEAMRARQKFTEAVQASALEAQKALQAREDAEMEEVRHAPSARHAVDGPKESVS